MLWNRWSTSFTTFDIVARGGGGLVVLINPSLVSHTEAGNIAQSSQETSPPSYAIFQFEMHKMHLVLCSGVWTPLGELIQCSPDLSTGSMGGCLVAPWLASNSLQKSLATCFGFLQFVLHLCCASYPQIITESGDGTYDW